MLIVDLHNDGTGNLECANYTAEVRVNFTVIHRQRIVGHQRSAGWPTLLRRLLEAIPDAPQLSDHTTRKNTEASRRSTRGSSHEQRRTPDTSEEP